MEEETEREIVQFIEGKSPVQAQIAYLRIQGLKQSVIASECGVPLNTVKSHMRRIRVHAKTWMASS